MAIDRKKLVCLVVGAKDAAGAQRWLAFNEDREWLADLAADPAAVAGKLGVLCTNPNAEVRRAAAAAIGSDEPLEELVAYRLFQSADSDECAAVIAHKVLR